MHGYQTVLAAVSLLATTALATTAPIPKRSACIPEGPACVTGTICAGNPTEEKCVTPMQVGQTCGRDPYWVCATHLDCVNHTCAERLVAKNGVCSPDGPPCVEGTVCAGEDAMKCVTPMGVGMACGRDPFWVCADHLDCVDYHCAEPPIPEGGDCLPEGSQCVDGTVCAGTASEKSCVSVIPGGGSCTDDDLSVCEEGFECIDGTCAVHPVPEGGDCLPEDSKCVEGTICVGTDAVKTCITPISPGGECTDDVLSVCEEDYDCVEGVCSPPTVPKGGDCSAEDAVCTEGTVCAGRPHRRRCVTPMPIGGRCGQDPRWVCEDGLVCMRKVCKPKPLPEGSDCLPEGSVCEDGTVCAGGPTRKRCVVPMQIGGPCGTDPRWICAEGLECMQKKCVLAPVPEGGNCKPEGSVCVDGTVCAGRKHRLCVKPMPEGGRCGRDPRWICDEGLVCMKKRCRRNPLDVGVDCSAERSTCVKGAVCAGSDSEKMCVVPGGVGDACGSDAFSVCETGYPCENGYCGPLVVRRGKACDDTTKVCADGYHCTDGFRTGSRVCGKVRLEGERCKNHPRHRCGSGLSCISGTCLSDDEFYP